MLAVGLLIELLVARPTSYASAIALTVLAFIAAAWLGAIVVGALRGQAWIRGAAIVWQVLQFAVGAGAVTGSFALAGDRLAARRGRGASPFVAACLATRSDRAAS